MKHWFILLLSMCSLTLYAETLPFTLSITGEDFSTEKSLELSDLKEGKTAIKFDFNSKNNEKYSFDLNYKALADNRSYPSNLDITVKDGKGNKLGYLFFAINNVAFLKKMGTFGLVIDINHKPVDVKFVFDAKATGKLSVKDLANERFVQDTLVSTLNFQMIRPVIVPMAGKTQRSQTYKLDSHPFNVNYTLKDLDSGRVEFQFNLNATANNKEHLLERIYYHAGDLATLRLGMFAGKYFHPETGTFKLVFYPAMGQTEPKK